MIGGLTLRSIRSVIHQREREAMEKNKVLSAKEAAKIEESMPEDAKRLHEIMLEASEIIERNKWNGVAKCIAETSEETCGCFGFVRLRDFDKLFKAGEAGFSIIRAAKAIQE